MRTSFALLFAAVGLSVASPYAQPQLPDFGSVNDAPSPSATGPALIVTGNQTNVYNPTTASLIASDAASTVATASTSGTTTVGGAQKRGATTQGSASTKSVVPYSSPSSTPQTSTSSAPPSSSPPSTTTSGGQTSTNTTSSSTACPTVPEAGTYCGFINPEDPCAPQPGGSGPANLSVAAYSNNATFSAMANNAPTPFNYTKVFTNLGGSVQGNAYLGLYLLTSYNTSACAAQCNANNLCTAFNIYIERDPSLNPTPGQCDNPNAITNYKCTLWGAAINSTEATNTGQYQAGFQVVITGSNGYDKTPVVTPPKCPGWTPPTHCPGGAINNPGWHMGSNFFPGPFNPQVCAAYAQSQTAYNKQHCDRQGRYTPCNMFNAYMIRRNGHGLGTYCSLFSAPVNPQQYGNFPGAWSGSNYFGCDQSWVYSLSQQDPGHT